MSSLNPLPQSPRLDRKPSDTFDVVGSRIEHGNMEPYTMFIKGSRNYRRTPTLHKYPRYPRTDIPSPRILYEIQQQQTVAELNVTQTKAPPPPSRSAQPFPTGDLVTLSGSAGNMFEILRGARLNSAPFPAAANFAGSLQSTMPLQGPHEAAPPLSPRQLQQQLGTADGGSVLLPQTSRGELLLSTSTLSRAGPTASGQSPPHSLRLGSTAVEVEDTPMDSPTNLHRNQSMRSLPLPPLSFGKGYDCGSARSPLQRSNVSMMAAPMSPRSSTATKPPTAAAMVSPRLIGGSSPPNVLTVGNEGTSSRRASLRTSQSTSPGRSPTNARSPTNRTKETTVSDSTGSSAQRLNSRPMSGSVPHHPYTTSVPALYHGSSRPMSSSLPIQQQQPHRKHLVVVGPDHKSKMFS